MTTTNVFYMGTLHDEADAAYMIEGLRVVLDAVANDQVTFDQPQDIVPALEGRTTTVFRITVEKVEE